jgi:hypothetical protein
MDKGTVLIDPTALAACIAAYNQTATVCTSSNLAPACRGVYVGTRAEGEPCGYGGEVPINGAHECKASGGSALCVWSVDSTVPGTTGTCHKAPHGKIGDACSGTALAGVDLLRDVFSLTSVPTFCFVDDGLYCPLDINAVCAPIVANGAACTQRQLCASASFCDSNTQTCMTVGTLGQSCTGDNLSCSRDLLCGANNQCRDPVFGVDVAPNACGGWPSVPN